MTEVLSAAQMRAAEQAAIDRGDATGLTLMERAGQGVVAAIYAAWPDLAPVEDVAARLPDQAPFMPEADQNRRAVLLCGPGNNGGDGFVIARLLADDGWDVDVFFYGDAARLPPDAIANYARWRDMGVVHRLSMPRPTKAEMAAFTDAASHVKDLITEPDREDLPVIVLIDALFGIGLSRPLSGIDDLVWHWDYLSTFRDLTDTRMIAVDVPSGLDADRGEIVFGEGIAGTGILPADLTVTFHAEKPGHRAGPHHHLCGRVVVADIGLTHD